MDTRMDGHLDSPAEVLCSYVYTMDLEVLKSGVKMP